MAKSNKNNKDVEEAGTFPEISHHHESLIPKTESLKTSGFIIEGILSQGSFGKKLDLRRNESDSVGIIGKLHYSPRRLQTEREIYELLEEHPGQNSNFLTFYGCTKVTLT